MITSKQLKKERSDFYKLGYETGYKNFALYLKKRIDSEEINVFLKEMQDGFEKYPFMDFFRDFYKEHWDATCQRCESQNKERVQ